MNRFITSSIATGFAALTIAGTALSGPALARSLSHEGYFKDHPDSGAKETLAGPASGGGYGFWRIAAPADDAAAIDRQIRHLPDGRFNLYRALAMSRSRTTIP